MTTIKEIAKKCNVSIATVSNIINGKGKASPATTELVLSTARELDYVPNAAAQHLKTKRTRSIGVIVEDMTIFSIPDIVDGITEHCEEMKYQILLINLRLFKKYNDTYYGKTDFYDHVHDEIRKLMNKQVEAVIYVSAHERVLTCIPEDLPIPAVMAYGYTQSSKVPSVVVDDVAGGYMMTRHLIEMGHRNIGLITGKSESLHSQARLLGFQKALYEEHIPFNIGNICTGDWTRPTGYSNTDRLLANKVSAVFCMNDLMAGGVYDRLEELGKIPGKDISLAGYDNRELSSYYQPPLTTVELPLHDIGYQASSVIIDMLQGHAPEGNSEVVYQVPCHLIKRKSVVDIR